MNILVFYYGLPALLCSITIAHSMEGGSLNLSQNATHSTAIIEKNGTAKEVDFMDVEAFQSATSSHDKIPNQGVNANSSLIKTATDSSLAPSANLELAKVVGKERGNVDKGSLPRKGAPVDVDNPHPFEDIYFAKEDGTKKGNSSPRKGAPVKEPSKPRKGAFLASSPSNNETVFLSNNNLTMSKTKPTASVDELSHLEGDDNGSNDADREAYGINYTGLIVGLCVGLILLTLLFVLSVRRIRNMWDQRQYKRLDFLIDGMYNEN